MESLKQVPLKVWAGIGGGILGLMFSCMCFAGLAIWNKGEGRHQAVAEIRGRIFTPDEIYLAYESNEAKADLEMLNKRLLIVATGSQQYQQVRKENGKYVYDFRSNVKHDWTLAAPRPVLCVVFRDSEAAKLATGQFGHVKGVCKGRCVEDFSYGGQYPLIVDATIED